MNRRKFLTWLGMTPAVIPAIAAAGQVSADATINEMRAETGYPPLPSGAVSKLTSDIAGLEEYADWSAPPYGVKLDRSGDHIRVVYFGEYGKAIAVQELRR